MKHKDNKKENCYLKIAFILTVIFVIGIGYVLSFIPNKLDVEYIEQNYMRPITDFVAEKSEVIQYVAMTISFPIVFIIFYLIIKKFQISLNTNNEKILDTISILAVIALIVKILYSEKIYIEKTILSSCLLLFIILLIIMIAIIAFYQRKREKNCREIVNGVIYAVIINLLGIIFYLYINNSYAQTLYSAHHVDAYFYPIYKILSGLTPGINFDSIYGYYSYFISMIMQLFGKTSIYFFSFIVAGLVTLALGCFTIFSNKVIKNKIVVLLTTLSFVYTLVILPFLLTGNYYLQYIPHRILFPAILLIYMILYLKLKNTKYKAILQLGGFVISSLAMIWNLETGIITLGVWICFLGYEILFFYSLKNRVTYKKIAKIVIMMILSILLYFMILNLIAYIRTGQLVGIKNIIYGQATFFGSGFYMLNMPLWHPWILLVAIYGIALVISIRNLKFMKEDNKSEKYDKNSLIFSLGILGMGIFLYYQGRSHNYVFAYIIYPAVILLGIYLDYLIENYTRYKKIDKINRIVVMIFILTTLTTFAGSTVYYLCTNNSIMNMLDKEYVKQTNVIKENIKVAKKIQNIVGEVDFVLPYEVYYYTGLKIEDKKNFPGYVDLFTYEDCKKIINYMDENDVTLCTDKKIYDILSEKYKDKLEKLIDNKYKVICVKDYIVFINKENWEFIGQLENLK